MDKITFSSLFSGDTLDGLASALTPQRVLITLGLSCAIGLFLLFVYRKTYMGVLYSPQFGFSLVMVTMVTALIIMPITSNLTLSLGMVGALSIVRFRTAVKDAMDTMYLFLGVAVGICLGAGFYVVAGIGVLVIALVMLVLTGVKTRGAMPYLLVIHYHTSAQADIKHAISGLPKHRMKSKVARGENVELTLEMRIRTGEESVTERLLELPGVRDASLITYQGDLIG